MEELSILAAKLPWEKSPSGDLQRKVLRVGADGKPKVALVRLEPGVSSVAHAHEQAENHYVLEGEYESQGGTYAAGSYRLIPPNKTHGPLLSKEGATLLVIWE